MQGCTVTEKIQIVPGSVKDYEKLSCYHYRDSRLSPFKAIFAMKLGGETIGVIVYSMPSVSR